MGTSGDLMPPASTDALKIFPLQAYLISAYLRLCLSLSRWLSRIRLAIVYNQTHRLKVSVSGGESCIERSKKQTKDFCSEEN
jgi:hypothetical protein